MPERVWEPYLTEQDRAHLAMTGERKWGSASGRPCCWWTFTAGSSGTNQKPCWRPSRTGPAAAAWRRGTPYPTYKPCWTRAVEAGIPVVHVTGLSDSGVESWSSLKQPAGNSDRKPDMAGEAALDRQRRRFDIIDECGPIDGEAVLYKTAPSAFWGTPLTGHLTRLGVDTLITCGESTSGCVRASVVDGCTNRYRMIVVEECVFDRHQATHAINLFDMHQKYADVMSLADVLEWLAEGRFETAGG